MQSLLDFIAGLLSALAVLAFAQFGVSVHGRPVARSTPPVVHRTAPAAQSVSVSCAAPCCAVAAPPLRKA